jgi:hypothetical protein
MKIKLFSPCHTKECSRPLLEMSATTVEQQKNRKKGKGHLQKLRKPDERGELGEDLFEIFLWQIFLGSGSVIPGQA